MRFTVETKTTTRFLQKRRPHLSAPKPASLTYKHPEEVPVFGSCSVMVSVWIRVTDIPQSNTATHSWSVWVEHWISSIVKSVGQMELPTDTLIE